MKRTLMLLTILAALGPALAGAGVPNGTAYGDGVTLTEPVAIATLVGEPDKYVGQKIRVDGVITGVCEKRGCWMQLSDADGRGVRVKVEDGVIVFPYTSMGHTAAAEGVFEAIKLSPEQIAARTAQEAEEKAAAAKAAHQGCDKEKAAAAKSEEACAKAKAAGNAPEEGAGCGAKVVEDTIYVLRGTGAIIS